MPKDRSEDRHTTKGRLIRPVPPELWDQLGDKVGPRKRNETISRLMSAYISGQIELPEDDSTPQPD